MGGFVLLIAAFGITFVAGAMFGVTVERRFWSNLLPIIPVLGGALILGAMSLDWLGVIS